MLFPLGTKRGEDNILVLKNRGSHFNFYITIICVMKINNNTNKKVSVYYVISELVNWPLAGHSRTTKDNLVAH